MYKVSYETLFNAYQDCLKHKKHKKSAIKFRINEKRELIKLLDELNNRTYTIGTSNCFLVEKPVLREVFAADFRDRIVHHLVINRILPYLEEKGFIDDSYSCRKGKGTLYGIKRAEKQLKECTDNYTKDAYILKGDFKGFFMSIDKRLLFKMISTFVNDIQDIQDDEKEFIIWILKLIIFNCPQKNCTINGNRKRWNDLPKDKSLFSCDDYHGLPIGNLSSQILANFYLLSFDKYMKDTFKYYGRYVDDFFAFSTNKDDLLKILPVIRKTLKIRLNVILHPKKIYLQHYAKGMKFIGAVIKPNRLYVSNRIIGNFISTIRYYNNIINTNNELIKDEIHNLYCSINSYLGLMQHYKSRNVKLKIIRHTSFQPFYKYFYFDKNIKKIHIYEAYQ